MVPTARSFALRLFRDEAGQDLIEYALLTTCIGFAGIFVWSLVGTAISNTYGSWVSSVDVLADPPNPIGGGS